MSDASYITISVASISVPDDRSRSLDREWADALAAMFADQGNKTAIEVRPAADGDGYVLVSGLHRLEAAKLLGWDSLTVRLLEIDGEAAEADYKLHEVMENLGRRELTILDRARHLHDFQQALYVKFPELKKGGDKQTPEAREKLSAILALRSDIGEKVGLSERSIQRAVQLFTRLSNATRQRADGTWLADHQAGLMTLAAVGAKMQARILDVLFDPDLPPKSVADAVDYIENGRLESAGEKRIGGLLKTFKALDDEGLDRVLSANMERVQAWIERKGIA